MVYEATRECECNGIGEVIGWVVSEALWGLQLGWASTKSWIKMVVMMMMIQSPSHRAVKAVISLFPRCNDDFPSPSLFSLDHLTCNALEMLLSSPPPFKAIGKHS